MTEKVTKLQSVANALIKNVFEKDPAEWAFTELVYLGAMAAVAGLVFVFALHFAGLFIFFERRIAARMQCRVGPNRVGPNGFFQWAVDGIKCLFKEDLVPSEADQPLFRVAPYFVVLGMVLAFAAMPFSSALIGTDINIGILFVLGVTSLVVIGLLMGGWGSNSKWALLGGMRSAAQVISYEIPAGLAAMTVIVMAGSLSMQDLIQAQGGPLLVPGWAIFHSPATLLAFVIFFIAQLAEGNRTPFDLPEAESELVSGYNTEYSGMRFLMFFLGEFANVWILCAVSVALFLGGWQIPFGLAPDGVTPRPWLMASSGIVLFVTLTGAAVPAGFIGYKLVQYQGRAQAAIARARIPGKLASLTRLVLAGGLAGITAVHLAAAVALPLFGLWQATGGFAESFLALTELSWAPIQQAIAINGLQLGIFAAKTLVLVFVVIQLRWTLPRVRVDQMMSLCWKYMVPISLGCVVFTLLWELITQAIPALGWLMRYAMAGVCVWGVIAYVGRVRNAYLADRDNFEDYRGEKAYFPPWRLV